MDYIYLDGVQVIMCKSDIQDMYLGRIVDTTKNTWQQERDASEKGDDTKQGKTAEEVFEQYVAEYADFAFVTYDKIRKDNFEHHAPFDGLIFKRSKTSKEQFENCKNLILSDVKKSQSGQISKSTRKTLRNNGIYTVEVKSTKASNRKGQLSEDNKDKLDMLIKQIRLDDFFLYPHFCRASDDIKTVKAYFEFVKEQNRFVWSDEKEFLEIMFREEFENASDIQIRMYIDEQANVWYIMGYILAYDIVRYPNVKKFKAEKSGVAVYLTRNLKNGKSVNLLFSDSRLWDGDFSPKYGFEYTWQLREYLNSLKQK